jgi:hypothetical protein
MERKETEDPQDRDFYFESKHCEVPEVIVGVLPKIVRVAAILEIHGAENNNLAGYSGYAIFEL